MLRFNFIPQQERGADQDVSKKESLEKAHLQFSQSGAVKDLFDKIEKLKRDKEELKCLLELRNKQLENANKDRGKLNLELARLKEDYAALKEDSRKRKLESNAFSSEEKVEEEIKSEPARKRRKKI